MYLDKDDIINLDECKAIENCMISQYVMELCISRYSVLNAKIYFAGTALRNGEKIKFMSV